MAEDDVKDPSRRDFLGKITATVGGVGVAATCWPFISSMNPSTDVLSKATTEVDLNGITKGSENRSAEQLEILKETPPGKDPQPDSQRVKKPEWLVVVGICTHLGCVPNIKKDGWLCPCHGSVYDLSGRILHGPAPRNLEVPPYRFLSDNKILIG